MAELQTLFFLGKGGTGKSTASALLSLVLMGKGKKVLLASFDDAHNQSDIFEADFSDKACTLGPCLDVLQIDRDREIKRYLKKTAQNVKNSYAYLTAFNLDNYFDILKFSPGMEEYALVTAFMNLQNKYRAYDYLIIDMPPTALSLRFFNLPALSLIWIDQLEKLRLEIYKRKEIISRIKFAGKEFERDKVLSGIREIKSDYQTLKAIFEDPKKTNLFVVFNQDVLSVAETRRITGQLTSLDIAIRGLICNDRMQEGAKEKNTGNGFPSLPIQHIPFSSSSLIGMSALKHHITSNNLTFDAILNTLS
ncbi:MAG: ArsA family ATPase [Desulfobacula sp.]|jgi:arsenite/tail-anchored protein-transporting ATPase|uniref:ArsA family ATPase n=1 Tax=Desulfobacula sp. TaxID=2593537 RepID=UPI001D2D737C|nr:ArsA family ATPase [Desulfobacula sp.]MBT6751743.1 ArsA family ATPase [Desulfobacula sp.]